MRKLHGAGRIALTAVFSLAALSLRAAPAPSEITVGLVDTFSPDFYIRTYSPTLDHLIGSLSNHRFKFVEIDYRNVENDVRRLRPDFLVTSASIFATLMGSVGTQ